MLEKRARSDQPSRAKLSPRRSRFALSLLLTVPEGSLSSRYAARFLFVMLMPKTWIFFPILSRFPLIVLSMETGKPSLWVHTVHTVFSGVFFQLANDVQFFF